MNYIKTTLGAVSLSLLLASCGNTTFNTPTSDTTKPSLERPTIKQNAVEGELIVGINDVSRAADIAALLGGTVKATSEALSAALITLPEHMPTAKAAAILNKVGLRTLR